MGFGHSLNDITIHNRKHRIESTNREQSVFFLEIEIEIKRDRTGLGPVYVYRTISRLWDVANQVLYYFEKGSLKFWIDAEKLVDT